MPARVENIKLVPNYLYLYHTNEFLILPEYPDSVQDKMNSTFAQTNALSRTAPVFTYSYSGPRQVQVQLHLHRDMLYEVNVDVSQFEMEIDEDYVDALVRKLQAVALPTYNVAKMQVTPPMVALRLGDTIFVKGVVIGGVSIEYQKPIMDDDRYAQCTLSFEIYETEPFDAQSVSQLGSFRGITSMFKDKWY